MIIILKLTNFAQTLWNDICTFCDPLRDFWNIIYGYNLQLLNENETKNVFNILNIS